MTMWKKLHNHCVPSKENVYRPSILGRVSILFFLVITLAVEGFLVASLAAQQSDGSFLSAVIASDIIDFTNSARHTNAVASVQENSLLDDAALAKAEDMASKGYFAHISPDGTLPWVWITSTGYDYQNAGENLAVRFSDSKDVVNAWMASPSHRDNILRSNYSEIGVGVAEGVYRGQPATFVVQYFASPKRPTVVSSPSAATTILAPSVRSFMQSLGRQLLRVFSNIPQVADWLLGAIAVILLFAVGIAFFFHIDVQSYDLLAGGMVVAFIALACLMANMRLLGTPTSQTAGVIYTLDPHDDTSMTSPGY